MSEYNPANDLQFMQQGYALVNSVNTHIITCGRWIEDALPINEKLLVLLIPGNPGAIEYYEDFVCSLYEGLQRAVPIWAISHAGHTHTPEEYSSPAINEREDLYSLEGQIEHKIAFIQQYIPMDRELILVGHSIGCYIILEIMKRLPGLKIAKSFLLFPTIERMSTSPNGSWISIVINYLRYPALLGVYAASYLGEGVQKKVVSWYLKGQDVPDCIIKASLNLFRPECVRATMLMARHEFNTVQTLDVGNVKENINRLTLYYGATDHWCPISYYNDMRNIFPDGDIRLCQNNFEHAFVLKNSKEMAALLAAWVLEDILGMPRDIHSKSLLV